MNITTLIKKIKNSFLSPRLHNLLIKKKHYEIVLSGQYKETIIKKFLKFFYFYPKLKEANTWAKGDIGNYRDYNYFEKLRPNIDEFTLDKIFELTEDKNQPVLDLGCNQGRHIRYLYNKGLKNLYGVDVMKSALKYFEEKYSDIYKNSNLECDFFQRYLNKTKDNFFYNTFTFGATIEIVHPSYDLIKEMVRVTRKNIILLISENGHWYPRFYVYEFKKNKTKLVYYKKVNDRLTLLIFEKT